MYFKKNISLLFVLLAIVAIVAIVATAVLYHYLNMLPFSWAWDDTAILRQVIEYSPSEYFFDPSSWQQFSASNLHPWILLSFELDLFLFGLNPEGFYLHQFVSIAIILLCVFFVFRLWVSPVLAMSASVLFLYSPPISTLSYQLMTRHYIEGLIFALLSIMAYVLFIRKNNYYLLFLAVFFYVLAFSAKEIYVPLPGLLFFLGKQSIPQRIVKILPFAIAGLFYIVWRYYMLGVLVGGYGLNTDRSITYFIERLSNALFSPNIYYQFFFAITLLPAIVYFFRAIKVSIPLIILILLSLLPLYPISYFLSEGRYMLMPTLTYIAIIILSLHFYMHQYPSSKVIKLSTITILCGILFLFVQMSQLEREGLQKDYKRYATQWTFIYNTASINDFFLVNPAGSWFAENSRWLRQYYKNESVNLVFDLIDLTPLQAEQNMFFKFDEVCQCVVKKQDFLQTYKKWQNKQKEQALSIQFDYKNNISIWDFRALQTGEFFFLVPKTLSYQVPAKGIFRSHLDKYHHFRIKYIADNGFMTYSPLFKFSEQPIAYEMTIKN